MKLYDDLPCDDCLCCHCPTTSARATISRLTQEREETRRYLVAMLAEFGDEDTWEGVYLADVARRLEKWLGELEPAGPPQWASEGDKKP